MWYYLAMSMQKFLNSIGLNEKDQKVYLALLELADAPVSSIARKTGLERTTAYHHLEKLLKLGLVSTYKSKNTKRFSAENPSKIRGIFEENLLTLEKYLPELQNIPVARKSVSLKLFEGEDGKKQLAEEELNTKEKLVRSIGSLKDMRESTTRKRTFTKRRVKNKIFSKWLLSENDEFEKGFLENQEEDMREIRILPKDMSMRGIMFMFDNKISVLTPNEEQSVGFLIESSSLSETLKSMFDALWDISQKTESN